MAPIHKMTVKEILGQLNGKPITKESLMGIIASKKQETVQIAAA